MRDTNYVRVNSVSLFSFELLGVVLGTILCILQGVGTIDIGWFWATFPFWLPIAVDFVVFIVIVIIVLIWLLIEDL